ncbi:MAG: hypothetical protein AAGD25_24270 [Cyanobacteria bacterium P01_F01_bin.150]
MENSSEKNPKVQSTAVIWTFATGMLGICIPLVSMTQSGIVLPLLVLLGAGGGTVAVWLAPEKQRREDLRLFETVRTLQERVVDLEAICTSFEPVERARQLSNRKEL